MLVFLKSNMPRFSDDKLLEILNKVKTDTAAATASTTIEVEDSDEEPEGLLEWEEDNEAVEIEEVKEIDST